MTELLSTRFREWYGKAPAARFFAPGRVNLIGEHIDYNGGLVMPCAITFGTWLLLAPNDEHVFRLRSVNFDEPAEIPLQSGYSKKETSWTNYPLGVIHYLIERGTTLSGMDMLYYGNVPIGSGLSSSASIEVVTAFAFNELFEAGLSRLDLVKLAKRVENEFIGLNSGIMDQFAVTFGEAHKALLLNCDTLDYQAVPCNLGDHVLAIINTNKPRKLAESNYNERVRECQSAVKSLQRELPITHLCEIDAETFRHNEYLIGDHIVRDRAQHVVEENDRVILAAEKLAAGDLAGFGKLMYASHESLRTLYEVSGAELDTIVDFCSRRPEVTGARMTGAGFGGCAIALVKKEAFAGFQTDLLRYYRHRIGYDAAIYQSEIGNGAGKC